MGSTPGRGQGGVLGAVPIGGRCPGAFFGSLGRRVLFGWCPAGHLPNHWHWPHLGPPLSGPFLACLGFLLALVPLNIRGICPCSCPAGVLGLLARAWPGLLFFGICACLGFWPFCFGLCGRAWPSGGGFVSAATLGGWLPFVFVALLVGIWLVVAPVVTSRDAFLL